MKPPVELEIIKKLKAARIAAAGTIKHLPDWAVTCRILVDGAATWLLVEPACQKAENSPGQVVIDLPKGRYRVEIFDTVSREWISRESTAGGPLVAGLPYTGNPLVVKIKGGCNA